MEMRMTAFNAVRFRVKPGREQEFLDAHKKVERNWAGLQHVNIIKIGDRTYCIIAEWTDMDALAAARPLHDRHPRYLPRYA
jgi:quinol monooxygenase YgiN